MNLVRIARARLGPVLCGIALCLGASNAARADSLYDNLSNAPGSILGTFPIATYPDGTGPEGDSFSTGISPFSLTDVVLKLQGVQDSASFDVTLFSDNDTMCAPGPVCTGGPLTPLYTIADNISDNSLSTSLADDEFSLASPLTLDAKTRYWIVASSTDNSGTLWSYTQDLGGVGVTGEFNDDGVTTPGLLPNTNDMLNNPGCFGTTTGGTTFDSCTPFQMEIVGDTVPEPRGLVIVCIGLAGLAGVVTRKKHSRMSG
ncbi:MAG TPA: choice-of-anchor R domain-containing protein [Bryobacteraceae bacterium]|jgi:hypothetical protein|nr:choice-of-anchor R domain-containing protein [Bryobacteraceae bacterium]